jgi:hypothetical protein
MADLKQQIGVMNSKIDSILRIVGSMPRTPAHAIAAPIAAVVPPVLPETNSREVVQKDLPKKKVAKKKGIVKK